MRSSAKSVLFLMLQNYDQNIFDFIEKKQKLC